MHTRLAPPSPIFLRPGDPEWDTARLAWNLSVDQQPEAIALPTSAREVASVVNFARCHGLRVAAQGTGHGAASLGPLAGTVLVKTHLMRRARVDPVAMTIRAEAGVTWDEVVYAAAGHGLAALAGSSPDVGVVGYALGGGMSWLSRPFGLCANNVEAFEVVIADGSLVHADATNEPDLFWALRGGGGSFGIVTAVELRLFPLTEVYAGLLWWPAEAGPRVLEAWRELTQAGPSDEFTTAFRYVRFPTLPTVPDPLRGGSFAVVDAIHLGSPAYADSLLAPLRALEPFVDTVKTIPVEQLGQLHMDPEGPSAGIGDGMLLGDLPADAVEALTHVAGPAAASPLFSVELRQIGGEMGRARPANGALAAVDASHALFAVGMAPTRAAASAVTSSIEAVKSAMNPWAARHVYLNIAETRRDPRSFWAPEAYERLRRIKAAVDPENLIRANHPIEPEAPRPHHVARPQVLTLD
jgi:FAD/FMN-containing dehydrogenase